MTLLENTLARIVPTDKSIAAETSAALAAKLEGDDSALGELKEILLKYITIAGLRHPDPPEKCTIICCADHGVSAEGVSAYPPETTAQMTRNYLISRGAAANALAAYAGSELMVVDMGIAADTSDIPGLIDRRIAAGTASIAQGPAMTREQAVQALETGIELAQVAIASGYDIILPGEMGIANTTSSAAIAATICGRTAAETTGRGTNISDERLARKVAIVGRALAVNNPDPTDGIDVLAKVGGFELGAIAGLILGAAAAHKCVILDGANSSAAALIAHALNPAVTDYLLPSHLGGERSHKFMLEKLGLTPVMQLDLKLGEACGSSVLVRLLECALALWETVDHLPHDPIATPFEQSYMDESRPTVTDKTFDFYLNTLQGLDRGAMSRCQSRLDNLAKPIYSLGYLEQLAVELAGISGDELPEDDMERALLAFTGTHTGTITEQLVAAAASALDADVTLAHLRDGLPATAAFDFGRSQAEYISLSAPVIVIGLTELDENAPLGTAGDALARALLADDGSLRYGADDFLAHAPAAYHGAISAIIGAIIAAAHNNTLVIAGDRAVDIIARYTEKLAADLPPYILHPQTLLQLGTSLPAGLPGTLSLTILDAALACLNRMRTFAETKVATADDGPGAVYQIK